MKINSNENDEFLEKKSAMKWKAVPTLWKRYIIKVARMKGKEFVNYQGKIVPQKCTAPPPHPPCK